MIRLFYNYYQDDNPIRRKEIDFCFKKNLENKIVNTIIIESQTKLTYNDFFEKINKTITNDDDINIICNSDIFLDDTIELANKIQDKQVFALSRWDWYENQAPVFFHRQDSQDTWIFRGPAININGSFTLGKRGCDNRIAYEFQRAGYQVINVGKTIKTFHVHNSNIRNYSFNDVVPGPYLSPEPTDLK